MSSVTFSGLATGLDTAGIVSQLVELKRAPIYRLQKTRQGYEAQKKALETFKTKLLALQEAALKIDSASEFSSLKTTVGNEDAMTASAGTGAAPGSYQIQVNRLAKAQKEMSQGYDSKSDSLGNGIISFTVDGETTDLTLVGYTSLQSLADKINNDVAGVSAAIIYDGSPTGGYHLVLSGTEAGSAGAFSMDMSGLSGGLTPVMTNTQVAQDAELLVDNILVTATSNNPSDVISGVTLNLLSEGEPATTLKVETDSTGIAANVKGLVDAYNEMFSFVTEQSAVGSDLRNNPALRSIASRIETIFSSSLTGGLGSKTMMAQVGITRGDARQVKFDEEKFKEALDSDFGGVRDLFIEREGNLGKTYLIDQAVEDMTDSIDGLFRISNDALSKKMEYADESITRYERSIASYQLTLERRFTAMEQMVSQLQAQGNYLSSITTYQ